MHEYSEMAVVIQNKYSQDMSVDSLKVPYTFEEALFTLLAARITAYDNSKKLNNRYSIQTKVDGK